MNNVEKLLVPSVIAHRGANRLAPENTLSALRRAKSQGANWVEFDVRLTKDSIPIVFHDDELSRTTNGKGYVGSSTFQHIQDLDAGGWFDNSYENERIPTFYEYIQLAAELGMGVNIELKPTERRVEELAHIVSQQLKQLWPAYLPRPLISSFSFPCIAAMRNLSENFSLALITYSWTEDWKTLMERYQCSALHVNYKTLSPERIRVVKKAGYHLLAYTVNDRQVADNLISQGLDAIFTDNHVLYSQ